MLIEDYINYCDKYKEIYEKSVILYQCGGFYELYGYENRGADIKQICEILDIQMTKRNKSNPIVDKSNPYMCGLPLHVVNKYIDILVENQFTIVLVEQITGPPNVKREVTRIISPSTNVESANVQNNFLMSIYFSTGQNKNKDSFITTSVCWVDVNTNETFFTEFSEDDTQINLEDVGKTILTNKPSEIVVFTDLQTKSDNEFMNKLNNFVQTIDKSYYIHNKLNSNINDNFFKLSYQTTLLKKVFKNTGLLSAVEYLDLEKNPLSIISFVYLIQFAYEHNEKILDGLQKPKFLENTKYLSLINNVVENLNIISKVPGKNASILNLLNNCKTTIGKRFFKQCLVNPLTNIQKIRDRYDMNDFFIKDDFYKNIRQLLINISDLERLFKRMIMKTLQPCEFVMINTSLTSFSEMFEILNEKKCNFENLNWNLEKQDRLSTWIEYYQNIFNLNNMSSVNLMQITKNIFNVGIHPEIDKMQEELTFIENIFDTVCNCLNEDVNSEFKLEKNKDDVRSIVVTKNRFQSLLNDKSRCSVVNKLLKKRCNLSIEDINSKPVSVNNKTQLKIIFKDMNENQVRLSELQSEFKNKVIEKYFEELEYFYKEYNLLFQDIASFVAHVDFFGCNAKNAIEKCYVRPEIVQTENSFIKTTKIRHPLIEVIQTDVPYISNDVEIGTEDQCGFLLYGVNAVGKSSLIKSIGINLIMAQCGMYVACNSFNYSPYDHIFSRIPSGDNLHKGQSTYVCEINEIRSILKRSTNKSLIIGDEIASGTETVSAISLIASTINFLSGKKSSFIFASHLHELCDLDILKNIKIYHLAVHFDKQKNYLVYDRILKKGSSDRLYGLEIAKSLDLPAEFLFLANQIRQEYTNMNKFVVEPKTSRYNSSVFFDVCSICNSKTEEIHHIKEQFLADKNNIIKGENIHKNVKSNLINVCIKCHDEIHAKKINVNGFIQTNNGVVLDVLDGEKYKQREDIDDKIKQLRISGCSFVKILNIVNAEFNDQKITLYYIKNLIKNKIEF